MKILHTSDWHLGAMAGDRSLYEDQKFYIDQIADIVKEENIDCILICGDVYDRSVASKEAIGLYDYAMTKLCLEKGIPVLVIAGNHDSAERLSSCRELLSKSGLYVEGSLKREVSKVSFEDTDIYLLPWITEEKVKSVFPEEKENIDSLEDAYSVVTRHIKEGFEEGKKNILSAHAFITSADTSTSDRAAETGFAPQVGSFVFDGFDYVALGHIHKPQDIGENIRYSGTPMPYSFGKEEVQKKSVTVIDTADMSRSLVPLKLLNRRKTLKGTLEEILNTSGDEREGYVRLEITDSYAGQEVLFLLREKFPGLLEIKGKTFEGEESTITVSIDEFEKLSENPVEVFRRFCTEQMNMEPDSHLVSLFEKAVAGEELK